MHQLQVTGNSLDQPTGNSLKKYYSDKFDVEHISNLSLFLYTRSINVIAKNSNGAVIGAHVYSFADEGELNGIIEKDPLINAANTSGKLYVHNANFCLVPSMLFDPTVKSLYLKFSTQANVEDLEVFYEGVDSNNIQVVGCMKRGILGYFDNVLPDLEIAHGASYFLSYLMKGKHDLLGQELCILAGKGFMYLAGFASSELKLFNRFPITGNDDFLKYTFSVLHQLSFDRMHCRITVLGDPQGIQVDFQLLNEYFKNIQITEPRSNQTYATGAEKFRESLLLESYWNA